MRSHSSPTCVLIMIVSVLTICPWFGAAQDQQGPLPPPPKFEVHHIPSVPHPGPPPIPQQEIVQRLAANEDEMAKIYKTYTFTQSVRVEDLKGQGQVAGEVDATGQVYTKPDGGQYWRVLGNPQSTLKATTLTLEDVRTIATLPL